MTVVVLNHKTQDIFIAAVKNENVRTQYNKDAAKLEPGDKQGRMDLKEKARSNTPEPFKTVVEKGRPLPGEQAKVNDPNFKGNANSTNTEVTEAVAVTGGIGKAFLAAGMIQSTLTISNSPTPGRETATETAGWVGAMSVGGEFAAATPGGPYPKLIAGFIGGALGFMAGKEGGDAVLHAGPIIQQALTNYEESNKTEGCTICDLDH